VNGLRTWFRTASAATRRAAALTAVLVAGLVVALTQVPLPLQARAFPVSGQSVVAHPDGSRLLVQHEHGIAIIDAATGEVTATIPMGTLVPNPGIAIAPGASRAVVLATTEQQEPLTVTVDVDRAVVTSVTALDVVSDRAGRLRPLGVGPTGNAIVQGIGESARTVGADGQVWRSALGSVEGVEGVPGSGPYSYQHLSIAPGGRMLYAANESRALVVDTATKRIERDLQRDYQLGSGPGPPVVQQDWTVLLAADGEHVFTSDPGDPWITVRTLDGDPVAAIDAGAPMGASGIALSPDGATLYAALAERLLAVDVGAYT
jgi:DNA-binding beta-propeller fold protein YncE